VDPFAGQRWYEIEPAHIAWHAFSVGILGLMLLILIVSVESLGEPEASVGAGPSDRIAVPVEVEPLSRSREHSRVRFPGAVEPRADVALYIRVDGHVARQQLDQGEAVGAGHIVAEHWCDRRVSRLPAAASGSDAFPSGSNTPACL
jgi:multidrug efflux pump subunit AcrA (membrane-fusion protein)